MVTVQTRVGDILAWFGLAAASAVVLIVAIAA
jgi:cytochrome oxidase assembly protein ShyY1